ncbi:hypothetical protein N5I84_09130 [Ralstonia sp. CHL-2022]|uniref:hypothetical protein n=1 Tax=Ralstonia mojiangensis TaxID=2953895 RepID=UPI0021B45C0E|nr:hypothetical protein [Ralstonia mojiangensis]MCT7296324.1 hypothetical protein [Ralstonia mojiangensis]
MNGLMLPGGHPENVLVVLAPPHQEYRAALTEQTIKKFGCTYRSVDENRNKRLLGIMADLKISEIQSDISKLDIREAIYVSYADKPPVQMLLGAPFPGVSQLSGALNGVAIAVDSGFVDKLYEWIAGLDVNDECSFFVRKAK